MLPTLRETVDFYGLMANKALGQNFLLDSNITDKIIRQSLAQQNIPDFHKNAKLTLVSAVSIVEGGAHDVILKEVSSRTSGGGR